MTRSPAPLAGSCLCGAIAYQVDALATPIQHCHCHTCRKAHAAACAPTAGIRPQHFRWLRGEERLKSFESSPGKRRHFCGDCGSHLLAIREGRPLWVLRVATLDTAPPPVEACHIWMEHAADWLEAHNAQPRHERFASA
ncbi:GFA family protein [Crenobacter cavernae]|uniref:GFA family protein n=1 Tax=Crenobacter cavernae TaxID=2290923 RepID=A0ABY0FEV2_9NEIS|nr:GFA family protein [Crenobacter cavernae]RXZ44835.1 GFA family protein [Crenobacter cavernae]